MSVTSIFSRVRQESTRDKVRAAIKEAILAGRLKTGERLTEILLSREFNVSRAVIREALQQLAHEGLVEQNSYKGTRVVQLSPQQIDEFLAARLLLEGEIVRQAQARLTDEDKKQLKAMARKLESVVNNPQLYAELDLALHERIWELSGNQTFGKLLTQITSPLFAMGTIMRYSTAVKDGHAKKLDRPSDHTRLIAAICDGTADEAVRAMREHITHNWKPTRQGVAELLDSGAEVKRGRRRKAR